MARIDPLCLGCLQAPQAIRKHSPVLGKEALCVGAARSNRFPHQISNEEITPIEKEAAGSSGMSWRMQHSGWNTQVVQEHSILKD